jgi:CubicO group peptidase (beta-lactamase class C family)
VSHETYYPPPTSGGGWRTLDDDAAIREVGEMDPDALETVAQEQFERHGDEDWAVSIVRNGHLVWEFHTDDLSPHDALETASVTKSFSGTAWGLLLEDSRHGRLPEADTGVVPEVDLDTPAYAYIPEGHPLTDHRKWSITVRHLLSMTSGVPGQDHGIVGMQPAPEQGAFEYVLGHAPNRQGRWVDALYADPGTAWDYSDPAINHLTLAFANLMDAEMSEVFRERVADPIGIESMEWVSIGGKRFLGAHTKTNSGVRISARDLARFGYLMLRDGAWEGEQLVPEWWVEEATRSSQEHNPDYGLTWWVNTAGTCWPGLPTDTFAAKGYRSNRLYVVPSLDLVVARVGSGPDDRDWHEPLLIGGIVDSVLDG